MSTKNTIFYTAGELADMFSLPKQTLLYYDKMGILKPEYVSDNNYRHYSMNQYMLLEIIITLRKLNVSISEIKFFLENKDPSRLKELLIHKQAEFEAQIKFANNAISRIDSICKKITHANHSHIGLFTLEHRHKQKIIFSSLASLTRPKDLIALYAAHNIKLLEYPYYKDKATGWIIDRQGYFSQTNLRAIAYYTIVNDTAPEAEVQIMPAGLYLSLHYEGVFHKSGQALLQKIQEFLECNHLHVLSDVYCMPIIDHWFTNNPNEYVTRVSMQVEYEKN